MWRAPPLPVEAEDPEDAPEPADESAPELAGELEARLHKLETLREHGLVTGEEYAQRRQAMLDEL